MTEEDQLWKQYNDAAFDEFEMDDDLGVVERELWYRQRVQARIPERMKWPVDKEEWYFLNLRQPYGAMPSREANDNRISRLKFLIESYKKRIGELQSTKRELYRKIVKLREEKKEREEKKRKLNEETDGHRASKKP